jgi:hypothetical protein
MREIVPAMREIVPAMREIVPAMRAEAPAMRTNGPTMRRKTSATGAEEIALIADSGSTPGQVTGAQVLAAA